MKNNQKGFAAFISLLVISAFTLAVAVSISLMGVDEMKSAQVFKRGYQLRSGLQGCLHEALIRIREDESYTGGTVTMDNITCQISVGTVGSNVTIEIASASDDIVPVQKNLQATVIKKGKSLNIVSVNEVE